MPGARESNRVPDALNCTKMPFLNATQRSTATLIGLVLVAACHEATTLAPIAGPTARLDIVSGDHQTGTVGQPLANPLVARVTDAAGLPVSGQIVNFRVTAGGGSVFAGAALSNNLGSVQELWTLGTSTSDSQTVEARAVDNKTGLPIVFANFRAVRVLDQYQNPVAAAVVSFAVTAGGGSITGASRTTDANGVAAVGGWTLGPNGGVNNLSATVGVLAPTVFTARTYAITAIASGGDHSCALVNQGTALCWGEPNRLGDGNLQFVPRAVTVAGGHTFSVIGAGQTHTCALTAAGAVWCWGINQFGQVGDGSDHNSRLTPVAVQGATIFSKLVAGPYSSCGLASGAASCWGSNYYGYLGIGSADTIRTTPAALAGGLPFASLTSRCGLTAAGTAYCWGPFPGNGAANSTAPVAVAGGLTFSVLVSGSTHNCGISGATTFCWGGNEYGEVGDTTSVDAQHPGTVKTSYATPTVVVGNHTFLVLAAGNDHTCGITSSGETWCWGANFRGQLGNATTTTTIVVVPQALPSRVSGDPGFTSLVAGTDHTLGLTAAGAAYCWGSNQSGQCGDGTSGNSRTTPTRVVIRPQ